MLNVGVPLLFMQQVGKTRRGSIRFFSSKKNTKKINSNVINITIKGFAASRLLKKCIYVDVEVSMYEHCQFF